MGSYIQNSTVEMLWCIHDGWTRSLVRRQMCRPINRDKGVMRVDMILYADKKREMDRHRQNAKPLIHALKNLRKRPKKSHYVRSVR